uniref:Uncharacterized protein n=1 Tax=Panagrolaimus sp. ES5 TaxID=591445 RepID=A0AC34FUZ1_9BILA
MKLSVFSLLCFLAALDIAVDAFSVKNSDQKTQSLVGNTGQCWDGNPCDPDYCCDIVIGLACVFITCKGSCVKKPNDLCNPRGDAGYPGAK